MKKTIRSLLFKLPAILLLIVSFIASIYAAAKHISGITWAVPVILLIILVLYFVGEKIANRNDIW